MHNDVLNAVSYKAGDHFSEAIHDFSQSLALGPPHAGVHTHRGFCYRYDTKDVDGRMLRSLLDIVMIFNRKLGEFDRSIDDYTAAISIAPDSVRAYNNRYCIVFGFFHDLVRDAHIAYFLLLITERIAMRRLSATRKQ